MKNSDFGNINQEPRIQAFTKSGYLPSGEHKTTWDNFYKRYGFNAHRRRYLRCLHQFIVDFAERGGTEVIVGGSFVTCKQMPSDIDFSIDPSSFEPQQLTGLKIPTLQLRRKSLSPLHFIPETVELEDGETFSAREFFSANNTRGIVVITL